MTIPQVIIKPLVLESGKNFNIYQDTTSHLISASYLPTGLDPNFKNYFLSKINTETKWDPNQNFIFVDLDDPNDLIEPTEYPNPYLKYFIDQSNTMFDETSDHLDRLFEFYRVELFNSTDKLFFLNSPPLSNTYCYLVPVMSKKNSDGKISNVFNANIWFFYFFQYLNLLDETCFANYVGETIMTDISSAGSEFIQKILQLLKINIEYYMYEISYMLNDLYASCPSTNPSDNMKNYIPKSFGCPNDNILAITLIFHRNHVPSILEIFQFIYFFISHIEIDKINAYLEINIRPLDPKEENRIRDLCKLLYHQIFGYFMDVYDSFHFESAANYSTNEYQEMDNEQIKKYVKYFLNGHHSQNQKFQQKNLSETVAQMEFYFIAEMINMRQIQKFYHNLLYNIQNISIIGNTSVKLIKTVTEYFEKINQNDLDLDKINGSVDKVRNYWDATYQSNSPLYYHTSKTDRYHGSSYLNTTYTPRHFPTKICQDNLPPPFPMPPSNPYGIDPKIYDHHQINLNIIPYPTTNQHVICTEIPIFLDLISEKNILNLMPRSYTSDFKLYPIDFFRIKHKIFFFKTNIPDHIKFIDSYQFNLLKFNKLAERIKYIFPIYDEFLYRILSKNLSGIMRHTLPDLIPNENLELSYSGSGQPLLDYLQNYLVNIMASMENGQNMLSKSLVEEMCILSRKIYDSFNNGKKIEIFNQQKPYGHQNLLNNNKFIIDHVLNSSDDIFSIITLLRDNFLSQYFYYVKHVNIIDQMEEMVVHSDNINQILYRISKICQVKNVDLSIFKKIPSQIYLFVDTFDKKITKIQNIIGKLDDFPNYIFNLLLPFSNYTPQNIYDFINITFGTVKEIYNYLLENKQFDYVFEKLSKYQPYLLEKLQLHHELSGYFSNIHHHTITEISNKYGIDLNNLVESHIKWYANDKLNFYTKLSIGLDNLFLKKISGNGGETFKQAIMADIFMDGYHPNLKRYFSLIANGILCLPTFFFGLCNKK